MKQCYLSDYIPKDISTNFLNVMPKNILEDVLQRIKDGCNEIIKDYNECVKDLIIFNKQRERYTGEKPKVAPLVRCSRSPRFAYVFLESSLHFPTGFIDECIDRGVLVKDRTLGFVFNENRS